MLYENAQPPVPLVLMGSVASTNNENIHTLPFMRNNLLALSVWRLAVAVNVTMNAVNFGRSSHAAAPVSTNHLPLARAFPVEKQTQAPRAGAGARPRQANAWERFHPIA